MTWAERVGDLATQIALVLLNSIRIVTELVRLLFLNLDRFVSGLGEQSETGLRGIEASDRAWVRLPGSVVLGIAFALLLFLSIFTVLLRQATTRANDFIVSLSDGDEEAEQRIAEGPATQPAPAAD